MTLPHPQLEGEIGILERMAAGVGGKKLIFPLFKKTLEHCDMLIAVNEAAKELYANHIPKSKIEVIFYGVDSDLFKYSPVPLNYNILAVSRLIRRRGLDYLIEAMPPILRDFPDAKLNFVGDGPRKGILQKKARELGVSSKVVFHGNVPANELVSLYKNCIVFCSLSLADGWNQPALEAMASGRPVICTDAPYNSMVEHGKTGLKVPFGDPDALSEKILGLFSNYELAEKMGFEGRKKAKEEHSWDVIAKKYYERIEIL